MPDCADACLACGRACEEAVGRLLERDRSAVDALIAAAATTRLVAELLSDGAEVEPGVADLCIAACERCVELADGESLLDEAGASCAACARCLRGLLRA